MFKGTCKHVNRKKHSNAYAERLIKSNKNGICKQLNIFYYINKNTREIRAYIPLVPLIWEKYTHA